MRHHKYTITLDGTLLTVFGDDHLLFTIDLLSCTASGGEYQMMVAVEKRRDMHQGCKSAFGRAVNKLLADVVDEYDGHTGARVLHLERWKSENVAQRFSDEASMYHDQLSK